MKISKSRLQKTFGREKGTMLSRLFSRRVISDRQKSLCSVACLQAVSDDVALSGMLDLALSDHGALVPLYEVILQGYLFCGYPRAIEAFFCFDSVAERRGLSLDLVVATPLEASQVLMRRGQATAKTVHRGKSGRFAIKLMQFRRIWGI